MELSCKSEYALLALIELAIHYESGDPLQIRQIAAIQTIPDRYLEQLLATLRRAGLIKSQRGARGGYVLAKKPWEITVLDVMNCIEGLDSPVDSDPESISAEGMVIREIWQEAGESTNRVLQKYTLKDLVEKRNTRRQLDIMYYI